METTTRLTTGQAAIFTANFENSGTQVNHIPGAPLTISRRYFTGQTCRVQEVREAEFMWADECAFPYRVSFADGTSLLAHASEVRGA